MDASTPTGRRMSMLGANKVPSSPLTPGTPPMTPGTPGTPPTARRMVSNPDKTRARDLLRKHYGLTAQQGVPSTPSRSENDPMDLDSSSFDPKSYYAQLIAVSSLPSLLKRENELLVEIRTLDGERQSLVYNHHHELIAASDMIGAMKSRAEMLDGELDKLKDAFSAISRLASEISIEQTSDRHNR